MTISKKTSAAPYPTARPDKTHFLSINPRLQGHTPDRIPGYDPERLGRYHDK